jgi:hypothetical protein
MGSSMLSTHFAQALPVPLWQVTYDGVAENCVCLLWPTNIRIEPIPSAEPWLQLTAEFETAGVASAQQLRATALVLAICVDGGVGARPDSLEASHLPSGALPDFVGSENLDTCATTTHRQAGGSAKIAVLLGAVECE